MKALILPAVLLCASHGCAFAQSVVNCAGREDGALVALRCTTQNPMNEAMTEPLSIVRARRLSVYWCQLSLGGVCKRGSRRCSV